MAPGLPSWAASVFGKISVQTVAREVPASWPATVWMTVNGESASCTGRLIPFSFRPVVRTPRLLTFTFSASGCCARTLPFSQSAVSALPGAAKRSL